MFSATATVSHTSSTALSSIASESPLTGPNHLVDSPHVHLAVYRSLDAAEAYANAASMVPSEELRRPLRAMAHRKRREAQVLKRRYCRGAFLEPQPRGRGHSPSMTKYLLDVGCRPIETMEQALAFLRHKERETLELYAGLSETGGDEQVKGFLQGLIERQRKHLAFLQLSSRQDNHVSNSTTQPENAS